MPQDNLELVLSFHLYVGSAIELRFLTLQDKCLHLPAHLTCPHSLWEWEKLSDSKAVGTKHCCGSGDRFCLPNLRNEERLPFHCCSVAKLPFLVPLSVSISISPSLCLSDWLFISLYSLALSLSRLSHHDANSLYYRTLFTHIATSSSLDRK